MLLKQESKFRKRYWLNFLKAFGCYSLIIVYIFYPISTNIVILLEVVGLVLYFYSYTTGFFHGKDKVYDVIDYMESGLRWKVRDAEVKMFEEADKEYYNKKM